MADGTNAAATEGGSVTNSWISGSPIDAGWYWVQPTTGAMHIVQVIWAAADGQTVRPALRAVNYSPSQDDQWYGPLDAPSAPGS